MKGVFASAVTAALFASTSSAAAVLYETQPLSGFGGPQLAENTALGAYSPVNGTNQIDTVSIFLGAGSGVETPRLLIYGNNSLPIGAPIFTSDYLAPLTPGSIGWVDFAVNLTLAGPVWLAFELPDGSSGFDSAGARNAEFINPRYFAFKPAGSTWVGSPTPFVFRIDGTHLSDSPNIPPVPPGGFGVPEPATWAMMVAGFGLAGAAARRRRPTGSARLRSHRTA